MGDSLVDIINAFFHGQQQATPGVLQQNPMHKQACPKCGYEFSERPRYHDGNPRLLGCRMRSEHLHWACGWCGAAWMTKTADAEKKP